MKCVQTRRDVRWSTFVPNITKHSGLRASLLPPSSVSSTSSLWVLLFSGGVTLSREAPSNWDSPAVVAPTLREPDSCFLMLLWEEIVPQHFLRRKIWAAWWFSLGERRNSCERTVGSDADCWRLWEDWLYLRELSVSTLSWGGHSSSFWGTF